HLGTPYTCARSLHIRIPFEKMKCLVLLSLFTLLSASTVSTASTDSKLHRVPFERLSRHPHKSVRETVQRTISRYSPSFDNERDANNRHALSKIQRAHARFVSAGSDPRLPAIDAERMPIQYNPSEIASVSSSLQCLQFVGQVGIGTPPQYFRLEFDIGSTDTWVALTKANCSQPEPCAPNRRLFHPHQSSSFEKTPDSPWKIEFSDKSNASGWIQTDILQVAGLAVDRQLIGMAMSLFGFKDNQIDGSFALGLKRNSSNGNYADNSNGFTSGQQPLGAITKPLTWVFCVSYKGIDILTPVENLIAAKGMRPEVGIWLGSGNQGGEVVFGGRDPARFSGNISYFDVPTGAAYWSVPVNSVAVEPEPIPAGNKSSTPVKKPTPPVKRENARANLKSKQPKVIFDTSTNLILLPPRIALKTHQFLHDFFFGLYSGYDIFAAAYTVPCNLKSDVWIELGSTAVSKLPGEGAKNSTVARFRISGADIVRERLPLIGSLFNVCFSAIQASKSDEDDWVLGNVWFMNNYVTLDHKNRQVGIAPIIRPQSIAD
ncbi:hypothetical protein KVV02_000889, partial [Mortierella alpina]